MIFLFQYMSLSLICLLTFYVFSQSDNAFIKRLFHKNTVL